MGHLIATVRNSAIGDATNDLSAAHTFIVARAHAAVLRVPAADPAWGAHVKRLEVDLRATDRPVLVQKEREKLAEVVNMLATVERVLSALRWFAAHESFRNLRVLVCHPTTSSIRGENDLVIGDSKGAVHVRCEVCDVVASSAGQNGKEKTDLASLECSTGVPGDSVRRFICTSKEFAAALTSAKRNWSAVPHAYVSHDTTDGTGTVLLELVTKRLQAAT